MCLCLANKKPSEREFFVPAGTDLGVKLLNQTNSGALNTMVPSELTGEVGTGGLLVFLVCWRRGRYRPGPRRNNLCP